VLEYVCETRFCVVSKLCDAEMLHKLLVVALSETTLDVKEFVLENDCENTFDAAEGVYVRAAVCVVLKLCDTVMLFKLLAAEVGVAVSVDQRRQTQPAARA
jgi:hypothetical protein